MDEYYKQDDDDDDDDEENHYSNNKQQQQQQHQQSKRLCPQCFKGFSSGKALGGHMRIHAQAASAANKQQEVRFKLKKQQQQQQQKIIMTDNPHPLTTTANNMNDETKPTCSLCCKSFPSKKSLFGHMRCHPDREWRGIQPPPAPPRITSPSPSPTPPCSYVSDPKLNNDHQNIDSSDSAANDDRLTKYVPPGWSVTDRRGRKALRTPRVLVLQPSSVDHRHHHDELRGDLDAFHEKVHKLEATNYSNSAAAPELIDDVTNRVLYRSNKKQKTELFGDRLRINERPTHSGNFSNSTMDKGKGKALVHEYFPEDDESDSRDTELLPNNDGSGGEKILMVRSNKKKRKVKLMADLESTEEGTMNRRYRCDICNKGFPSHQALGGHRSSHNKFKVSIIDAVVKKEQDHHHHHRDDKSRNQQKRHQQRQQMVLAEETHQCKICNKSFLTGQALGGHQRCHWTPPQLLLADELPAPTLVTSSAEASQITGRRVVDFDLNEMPPMEEGNWDSSN